MSLKVSHPMAEPAPPGRHVLVVVTGRDRADQRVHTEVFYTRKAAREAWDMLSRYGSIDVQIIEDSHG
jgi:hypothetical protein